MLRRKSRSQAPIGTLVGAETKVYGDIEFTGGFHVDGYVKGNVRATLDDRSTLSISERGCIEGSVVVPGTLPSKDGKYGLYCAVIVKKVDEKTRAKTSLNELLRSAE